MKTVAHELLVPQIQERRKRLKIPEEERYWSKWQQAVELIDQVIVWGRAPPTLVGDAGYGQVGEFRHGLTERDIRYVLATTSSTSAQPGASTIRIAYYGGQGQPPS